MTSPSKIDATLRRAYEETHYHIDAYLDQHRPLPLTLYIGQVHPTLRALHTAYQVQSSTFLSASNPFSKPLSDAENQLRQSQLAADLRAQQVTYFNALGRHPSGQWPAEPSFLALGLPLAMARQLGERYDQNAIVWSGEEAVPELILLR